MKKKNRLPNSLIVALLIAGGITLLFRHFYIKDFRIVKASVLYTSNQPRGMDYMRLLYKYHIVTIVNVRPVSEHQEENWRNEEINWTRNNGVRYVEIPIEGSDYFPGEKVQNQFLEIMGQQKNRPVLLHGYGDDKRVAMLVAVWLVKGEGYNSEQTLEVIKKIIDDREPTSQEVEFIRLLAKQS